MQLVPMADAGAGRVTERASRCAAVPERGRGADWGEAAARCCCCTQALPTPWIGRSVRVRVRVRVGVGVRVRVRVRVRARVRR